MTRMVKPDAHMDAATVHTVASERTEWISGDTGDIDGTFRQLVDVAQRYAVDSTYALKNVEWAVWELRDAVQKHRPQVSEKRIHISDTPQSEEPR